MTNLGPIGPTPSARSVQEMLNDYLRPDGSSPEPTGNPAIDGPAFGLGADALQNAFGSSGAFHAAAMHDAAAEAMAAIQAQHDAEVTAAPPDAGAEFLAGLLNRPRYNPFA